MRITDRGRIRILIALTLLIASVLATGCGNFKDVFDKDKPGDTGVSTQSYSISGSVMSGGVGLPEVLLTLSGGATGTVTTDAAGEFTFPNLANGSYTITASKAGYTFSPESLVLVVDGTNVIVQDFTAAPRTYAASGAVTLDGAAFPGVLLALSGGATGTATTDAAGKYLFSKLANGSYTITPSKSGFSFSPDRLAVVINGSEQTGGNFTAVPLTYSVSGTITAAGAALPGVMLALSGAGSAPTTTTDSSGNYRFTGIANGLYTITPFRTGYTFIPGSASIAISGKNITGQNFTGSPVTSATRAIPDTGQTRCYGPDGGFIDCAGTGQDGAYSINSPSYTDNGDGTITDNVTGLVWQKRDDGKARTWQEANAYCSGNTPELPGTGWRLATSAELNTIVDYGRFLPAIDTRFFLNTNLDMANGKYWSSTSHAADPASAWYQIFLFGFVASDPKTALNYVRCVR